MRRDHLWRSSPRALAGRRTGDPQYTKAAVGVAVGGPIMGFAIFIVLPILFALSISAESCNLNLDYSFPPDTPTRDASAVVVSPNGLDAFISYPAGGTVEEISTRTLRTIRSIAVGRTPTGLALSPGGRWLYVADTNVNKSAGYAVIVDTRSGRVTDRIRVGSGPTGIALTPGGRLLLVADTGYIGQGRLSVINTANRAVTASIPVGLQPTGVAVTSDGRFALVVNSALVPSSLCGSIPSCSGEAGSGNTAQTVRPSGSHNVEPSCAAQPTGLPQSNTGGCLSVIDLQSFRTVATVPLGAGPMLLAMGPHGRHAYVADNASGTLSVVDLIHYRVTTTWPVGNFPFDPAITPNGGTLLIAAGTINLGLGTSEPIRGSLVAVDISTGRVLYSVDAGADPVGVAPLPHTDAALVVDGYGARVSIVDISTGRILRTATPGWTPSSKAKR